MAAGAGCWVLGTFGLFQMALIAGNDAVREQFGVAGGTGGGVYVAAVLGSLALAGGFVACLIAAGRRGSGTLPTMLLVVAAGLFTIALMLTGMLAQQLTWEVPAAEVVLTIGSSSTTFAQGLLGVVTILLLVGAAGSAVSGLVRRRSG